MTGASDGAAEQPALVAAPRGVLRAQPCRALAGRRTSLRTGVACPLLHARRGVAAAAGPQPGGAAPTTVQVPEVYLEGQDEEMTRFQELQRAAPRISPAEQARTMVGLARFGMLSTLAAAGTAAGSPSGSVVEFAVDGQGRPLLATSTLSPHTADLAADGRCSLTVMEPGFQSLQDARFCLSGVIKPLPEAERAAAREAYLAKYPDAFYVDFGDFRWWRMEQVVGGRLNGGFARAATLSAAEYAAASPDPVAQFSGPVCGHMNDDHQADTLAMVSQYAGLQAAAARLLTIDRLGMDVLLTRRAGEKPFRARLPFSREAPDRKSIKEVIVEMTRGAKAAAAAAPGQAAAPAEQTQK